MRKSFLIILAAASLFSATAAFADTITVESVLGALDSSNELIGPYGGKFNGIDNSAIYCDDLNHNINITPDLTYVNVSDINHLALTRFGGSNAGTTLATAMVDYEKIFYLSSFLTAAHTSPASFYGTFGGGTNSANDSVEADIQDAMWTFFAGTPQPANSGTNQVNYWLSQASDNYAKYSYKSFRIFTDSENQYSGKQELFINTLGPNGLTQATPEPGTVAMMLSGLAAVAVGLRRRSRAFQAI